MTTHICRLVAAIGLTLLSPSAFSALEDVQSTFGEGVMYAFFLVVVVAAIVIYFMRFQDKRRTPLNKVFAERDGIHSVGPDALVSECASKMTSEKIGALVVMDGERLIGIFTERDALSRVLAQGLDPGRTKVSDVMTRNPYCIPPATTVDEAMRLVTTRRFRHLPVVENNKVLAVISSGDLTHWLVKDKIGEVQELVDLAARS
jgi:CBS domain-containing protein